MIPGKEASIIESFTKHVKTYNRYAQIQNTMAERLAAFLPTPIPNSVLEIGCGTGLFTKHLLTLPEKNLILNDIAPAMINYLKEQINLPDNTQIIIGNAEKVHFPRIDLIGANAVFQWFESLDSTLSRFFEFLLPEGRLLFSTFGPKTLQELRTTAEIESPTNLISFNSWKKKIKKTGYKMLEGQIETRKIFFPSGAALLKSLQQSGTAPFKLLGTGRLRKIIKEYDRNFSSAQGVYSTWEIYYFSLHKPDSHKNRSLK